VATTALARALRDLRVSTWREAELTQAQLAEAFSIENRVGPATISTWESPTSPKTPNPERLRAYARFFATPRSLENGPRLLSEAELTEEELREFRRLKDQLLGLLEDRDDDKRGAPQHALGSAFTFSEGHVVIICPDLPKSAQGPLAQEQDPNFTMLQRYADLDALIELHGHVRAANPTLDVFHRRASRIVADDLSAHVILLGGGAWNAAAQSFQDTLEQVPVKQVSDPESTWDPFAVDSEGTTEMFDATWKDRGGKHTLTEDVGYLARLANPYNSNRTLTICNGIYSRGVVGAVRSLTDATVRARNEQYLTARFPEGEFALLMRVPVVANQTLSPDLQNPRTRRFEWSPEDEDGST
jgi:transcriptional regulator with XRE-family HTH domain